MNAPAKPRKAPAPRIIARIIKPAENAEQPTQPLSSAWSLVGRQKNPQTGKLELIECLTVRTYWNPRADGMAALRACVWARSPQGSSEPWASGRGSASGCGYHKESAAIEAAIDQWEGGRMMRDAFHSEEWDSSDCEDIPPGYTVRVEFTPDDSSSVPWEEHDGHGEIRTVYAYYGHPEKKPGERVIHEDSGTHWIYDVQGAIRTATRDGWGIGDDERAKLCAKLKREPTKREIIARAVELDAEYCAGWLDGRYSWAVCWATVLDPEGEEVTSDCVGGVEWDGYGPNTYATEDTAGDVVSNALHAAGLTIQQRRAAWVAALREARERRAWAARGVATV